MKDYVIITDSTTDLRVEQAEEWNIKVIPMTFTIQNKNYENYLDGREMDYHTFYNFLRNKVDSTTAQISPAKFIEAFTPVLEAAKDILYISFSSGLSSSYNSAIVATKMLKEDYPDANIEVIDSLCASYGEGLFVYYAYNYKKEGKSLAECKDALLELRPKLCHWFTVDDMDTLLRGGRVTGAQAFVAKTLKIKPVLNVDDEGHLIPRFKKVGRKSALKELVNQMTKLYDESIKQTIFLAHGDCLDDALFVKKQIEETFGDKIDHVELSFIGPVIGTHSGPGTIALFFVGSKRQLLK